MELSQQNKDQILDIKPTFAKALLVPALLCVGFGVFVLQKPVVWQDLFVLVIFYQIALFGISVANHRYFSHKAFKATAFFEFILFLTSAIAFQTPALTWAAVHRKHHQYSDREEDPHSPWFKNGQELSFWQGFWHSHVYWIFDLKILALIKKYTPDLYQNSRLVKWQRFHVLVGIVGVIIPGFIEAAMLGSWDGFIRGVFWGGFFRVMLLHNAIFLVNSWGCHYGWGHRAHETTDKSTNNAWLFPFILGEAWHNNHHAFQASATTSHHWYEFDQHYWMLKAFEKIGWVSDLRTHA
ncbi:acyl-CoA desaturase [Bdellovibrio sp. HCB-162]|uniref:acyl-CoA desaturase n=1 Tax=Bdellovibrio sp. HCB-162 TaxID=3394234 RepID=UPI0039BD8122